MANTPVILVTYKRPSHTQQVLSSLREHNIQNLFIFSDGPKNDDDLSLIYETRLLFERIDWTEPTIVERRHNIGLADSIVSAVNYVFEKFERLILLEDDCVPQKYFFDFIETCLNKYQDNEKIFGITGYTVPIPESILKDYPYDLYFYPRIGSWGWATWKRAWQHFEPDLAKAYKKARETNIDISQGGTDIPVMIHNMMNGQLRDIWTLNWVLSVYLNSGYYIYPTRSHIDNIGWDGSGAHCGKANGSVTPIADRKPTLYPNDVFINQRMYKNFRSYYNIPGQQDEQISSTQQNNGKQNIVLPCLSNDPAIHSHDTELMISQAIEQLNANNNAVALHLFNQAVSRKPNMPGIDYGKALALARLGRTDDAVEALKHLLAVMPDHKKARLLLGEIKKEVKDVNETYKSVKSVNSVHDHVSGQLIKVVADTKRMKLDNWNNALSNKILHILFILKIAETHKLQPIIPCESNVDNVFHWKNNVRESLDFIPCIYSETTAFSSLNIDDVIEMSKNQFCDEKRFLSDIGNISRDFSVSGHFWHYELMPSFSTFSRYIGLKKDNVEYLLKKYATLLADNSVAVHLRGTDFSTHLKKTFNESILIDDYYYRMAIKEIETKFGKNIEYHLFSDDINRLIKIFEDKNCVVHDDPYYIDWTAMFLMKNIISSNSSFSWTASLYDKEIVIQPYCGYNYHNASGSVPYGFKIPGSIEIKKKV